MQFIDKSGEHARLFERVLRYIVLGRRVLPSHLYISDVDIASREPIGGGGFADVYKGLSRGCSVAIKVPRIFGFTEEEVRKVSPAFAIL